MTFDLDIWHTSSHRSYPDQVSRSRLWPWPWKFTVAWWEMFLFRLRNGWDDVFYERM